jgi:hypothetical protein
MNQKGTLRKRGNTWRIAYYDERGKRIWEPAGSNEKEARKLLNSRIEAVEGTKALEKAERARGTYREPSEETLEECGKAWLRRREARLAPSTLRS